MFIKTSKINSDEAFKYLNSKITAAGMTPPKDLEFNKPVRFSVDGNDDKNGWYVMIKNPDGSVGGKFGDWRSGYEKGFFIAPCVRKDVAFF